MKWTLGNYKTTYFLSDKFVQHNCYGYAFFSECAWSRVHLSLLNHPQKKLDRQLNSILAVISQQINDSHDCNDCSEIETLSVVVVAIDWFARLDIKCNQSNNICPLATPSDLSILSGKLLYSIFGKDLFNGNLKRFFTISKKSRKDPRSFLNSLTKQGPNKQNLTKLNRT